LNWIATNIPPLETNAFLGEGKNFFFSHLERLTQSDGRVATRTYFSRSHDFPSRETLNFYHTLWSGLFLFLLFQQENPVVWLHSYVDGVFHNLIYSLTEIV